MSVTSPPTSISTSLAAADPHGVRDSLRMAGVICVDIHGFNEQTSAQQAASRRALIAALRDALAVLPPTDWWQVDVQHGVLIVCPASPDPVMYLAQTLLRHPESHGWCMGLHMGMLQRTPNLEGQLQTVGDGVARARLMASHALPAQALASRAFAEVVNDSRPAYMHLLEPMPAPSGQSTGLSPRWVVKAPADGLQAEWAQPINRSDLAAAKPASSNITQPLPAHSTAELSPWMQARDLIARWFVPVNALLFSIGLLLTQGHRVGLTEQRLLWTGLGIVLVALVLVWRRRSHSSSSHHNAIAWVGLSYGSLLSAASLLALVFSVPPAATTASPESSAPVPATPAAAAPAETVPPASVTADVPSPLPGANTTGTTQPTSRGVASSPDQPKRSAPPQADSQAALRSAVPKAATTVTPQVPPKVTTVPLSSTRCSAIVARSALGEPLSPEDKQELVTSCR